MFLKLEHVGVWARWWLTLAALLGHGTVAHAIEPIILKFSHVVTPDAPKGRGAEKFKELAEKYTQGRVIVELYPNSQLYKDKEEIEALQLGAVQMLAPSLAKFGPLGAKQFEVFDLPFLMPNITAVHAVFDGAVGQRLLASLESKGLKGLAYWDNGFRVFTANRPLKKPADFFGLKMRIQSSKVLEAQMRALGGVPQVMAFSEVYQALQTGVVDGSEGDRTNAYTAKLYEVQKYITLSDHGYLGYAVIVNKPFWDGLPADVREALARAVSEATDYVRMIAHQLDVEAEKAMTSSAKTTLIHLTPAERGAWIEALGPIYNQVEGRIGKPLIEEVRAVARASGEGGK
jgi:C4-dicarboxylate-binding protein DctP